MDTLHGSLTALIGIVGNMQPNVEAMLEATEEGFTTATDLADYLVRKGLPFRAAHEAVGAAVATAAERGIRLDELDYEELRAFAQDHIEQDVFSVLTVAGSVAARNHTGGTAPQATRHALTEARARIPGLFFDGD